MKNKFLGLKQIERSPISKLGLNVNYLRTLKKGILYYDFEDIINDLIVIRNHLERNNISNIDLVLENRILKKETIFKSVYKIRNNFNAFRVHKCLKENENKQVVIDRLDLIILNLRLLATTNRTN